MQREYQIVLVGVTEAQKNKLPKIIITVSGTNNTDELRKLYSVADIFINLTYDDDFPTVNLEAEHAALG